MDKKFYLAIDIGASSGRHIVGSLSPDGKIETKEVYRFPNQMTSDGGNLVWELERLCKEVLSGIKAAFKEFPKIQSLAIDTWGVDYALLDKNDRVIYPVYAYRDARTAKSIPEVHKITDFNYLYTRTGIQFQTFNTVYQLYDDLMKGRLNAAESFLMIPEYINFYLTGIKKKEYTIESTTGLVNAESKSFDAEIIKKLGFPERLFVAICEPSEAVGFLKPEIAAEVGGQTEVLLCPSHDTASAFEALDNEEDSVVLSSGTWSLIGVKLKKAETSEESRLANFANEGGVGYYRYLKNITGLWLDVNLHKEFGLTFPEMTKLASESSFRGVFDVNDASFVAPEKMSKAISNYFTSRGEPAPKTEGDYCNSVYLSLATGYNNAIKEMETVLKRQLGAIYIVGGGAKNALLNRYTAELTGKKVVPLPIEATSIGNLKTQIKADLR